MKKVAMFIGACLVVLSSTLLADGDNPSWLIGKWKMHYDPDNAKTDYLEFMANGDLVSSGSLADVQGFYTVVPGAVKGVLTHEGKDLLLTFFHNQEKTELRIVTSSSGIETVYRKMKE